jgi:hypothetical protein
MQAITHIPKEKEIIILEVWHRISLEETVKMKVLV